MWEEAQACEEDKVSKNLEKGAVDKIASRCVMMLPGGAIGRGSSSKFKGIFEGTDSYYQTQEFQQAGKCLPLIPLTGVEQQQLRDLFHSSLIPARDLTLMDFLGVRIYGALTSLVEENKMPSELLGQFCRDWLIGAISQALNMECKTLKDYSEQFIAHMEETKRKIALTRTKKNKSSHNLISNCIDLLLKIWKMENSFQLLQRDACCEMSQFNSMLPAEKADPKEIYGGTLIFINFIMCAFNHTREFEPMGPNTSIQCLQRIKEKLVTFNSVMRSKAVIQPTEYAKDVEIVEEELSYKMVQMQKELLKEHREVLERAEVKKKNIEDRTRKVIKVSSLEAGVKVQERIEKSFIEAQRCNYFHQYIESTLLCVDDSFSKLVDHHFTVASRLNRLWMVKNMFIRRVQRAKAPLETSSSRESQTSRNLQKVPFSLQTAALGAAYSIAIHREKIKQLHATGIREEVEKQFQDPKMAFLLFAEKEVFVNGSITIVSDLKKAFNPGKALINYAQNEIENLSGMIENRMSGLIGYQKIYKPVTELLECCFESLKVLQKTHSQILIELLNTLSVETCRAHQEEILDFFEDLFLEYTLPICTTYFFHQDMHFLTQDATAKQPLPFMNTPLAIYIMMEDFEHAFFEKIACDERPTDRVNIPEVIEPLEGEEEPFVPTPLSLARSSKLDDVLPSSDALKCPPSASNAPSCATSRQKKSIRARSSLVSKVASLAMSQRRSSSPLAFRIRRGEKMRKILKKLKDLGLECVRQRGSHMRLENSEGEACTLSSHGEGTPLTATVRRGVEKQLNERNT